MDTRTEMIELETTSHRIRGAVTLAAAGARSRISDLLNATERDFLLITDAEVEPLEGGPATRHEVLAVARAHIVLAMPGPVA